MGMYFNTVQTSKMVARLNKHFGPTAGGGLIDKKRNKKKFFKKGGADRLFLRVAAEKLRVSVDADEDPDNTHQDRWEVWLEGLKTSPSEVLAPVPVPPSVAPPKSGPKDSKVDIELGHLIFQGLNDTSCEEIVFVVLPGPEVAVDQPQTYGTADVYSLIITIRTVKVSAVKARLRRLAQTRRLERQQATKAKKKA